MNTAELEAIVDAWIAAQDAAEGSAEHHKNVWAIERAIDWSVAKPNPDLVWRFILAAYKRNPSEHVLGMIAAGPLEDLLSGFGPMFIDRVEELAANDDQFKLLLSGLWHQSMTADVWNRVQNARSAGSSGDR